jgi:hypothetical protein
MKEQPIHIHVFNINEHSNGGETVSFITEFFDNGDGKHGHKPNVFMNQTIGMQSYSNAASLFLTDTLSPEMLRDLANQIEIATKVAKAKVREKYNHE